MSKQIEEMAELICEEKRSNGTCSTDGCVCNYNCEEYRKATALYNAGYCKVDEEKYKKYLATKSIETNLIEIEKDKSRKETAREFLEKIKTIWKANNGVFSEYIFDILALEFGIGVEVE